METGVIAPPFLSVVETNTGPALLLTVAPEDLHVCTLCPHLHVRVLPIVATPNRLRQLANAIAGWADRLERVS